MSSLFDDYDRQQAFATGFALAARERGLTLDAYAAMCKAAEAAVRSLDSTAAASSPEAVRSLDSIAAASSPAAAQEKRRMDFVAEKLRTILSRKPTPHAKR